MFRSGRSMVLGERQRLGARERFERRRGMISERMSSLRIAAFVAVALMVLVGWSASLPAVDKDRLLNEVDLVDDDGSIDTALINYLFTKQIVKRLRSQLDIGDLQRKRSYWKQCAFNAVSCFGK
ncbi:prohormone-1 isoform X1 [Andrena cerasifolii]|uniref:prohormone-1 isoform X1 n=2 Tax=Andrena cerasifolii TaxID=2819439 RepID=UPI004037C386